MPSPPVAAVRHRSIALGCRSPRLLSRSPHRHRPSPPPRCTLPRCSAICAVYSIAVPSFADVGNILKLHHINCTT
eukprot:5865732-Pyramimonas_sp.AAC.2